MKKYAVLFSLALLGLLLFGCTGPGTPPVANTQSGSSVQAAPPVTNTPSNSSTQAPSSGQPASLTSTGLKFSDSQYVPYAVQIAPGPLTEEAKRALSGFTVNQSVQTDGSIQVTVTENANNESNQVTVKPGYTLYFIETSYGDDEAGSETSLRDDGMVLVDSNGYIVH